MEDEPDSERLDVWLDIACLFKTRSQAQNACKGGKVEVNGVRGKPHRMVRAGDRIRISLAGGRRRLVEVLAIEHHSVPRTRARELYDDQTPPPTPAELEARRMLRLIGPARRPRGAGMPKKRERRQLRRMKEEYGDE